MSAERTTVYLESSAGAKLLVAESETAALQSHLDTVAEAGAAIVSSVLLDTELRRVAQRAGLAQMAVSDILDRVGLAELDRAVFTEAGLLPGASLRSLDALHVAAALRLGADEFLSYDVRQLAAAQSAGLRTRSP